MRFRCQATKTHLGMISPCPSQRKSSSAITQWVALDGDRLIAHGANADEVFAIADADGAYLPLGTYIPPADAPPLSESEPTHTARR
jgi:uncharacterized protein DUF5678